MIGTMLQSNVDNQILCFDTKFSLESGEECALILIVMIGTMVKRNDIIFRSL